MCYKKDLISLCWCTVKSLYTYTKSQALDLLHRAPLILKTPCLGDWIGEEFLVIIFAAEEFLRNETPNS